MPRTRTVLVLSDQPMTAALLGMLLELEGYEPAFARDGENAEAALARVQPLLVVLVDYALDVAKSDLFLARVARRQVGIVMFGAQTAGATAPAWAQSRRVPWFRMPVDGSELRRAIEESTASFRLWRTDVDRRRTRAETDSDGTLVYHDQNGRRWRVYDRRGSDRRQNAVTPGNPVEGGHRTFVNEAGETWRVDLAATDFADQSPTALERQLGRATRAD
jgi:CheY-like chemotaxis protein